LYTVGQSKGLGMTYHEKLFVIKIDPDDNSVWVGEEKYLYTDKVSVIEPKMLSSVNDGETYDVKIRYQHKASPAQLIKTEKGFELKFAEAQRAVTPGQAAVIYKNKKLIGGGWITLK
jgi:tRNA-uridine 2-sulfurtransferase